MRFLPNGPDIQDELIAAQENGQTIFVCGAGISRTVGLPLFRGLVEGIYQKLGEDWNPHPAEGAGMQEGGRLYGQYDRVLCCLERRLGASDSPRNRGMRGRIRTAVRELLAPPNDADLANHLALLKLSRDAEGGLRLLTTNFDTLFERAWFRENHSSIESYAGSAVPQPKTARCTGVRHLHGRLFDPWPELANCSETDLVLTSAEFGDAYLRSGWASRYVYDLARAYTVVLVEALDSGFLDSSDRTSWDVPSVALHPQNAHRSGFYPIIRVLADLWRRIADRDRDVARTLALRWPDSHFLLVKRLWLFALSNCVFTRSEAAESILKLDNNAFWDSGAQVEIMRLLASRWMEFDPVDRSAIEARLRQGIARDLFPPDAFNDESKWVSIRDSSIFKRLKRLEAAAGILSSDSHGLLNEISARHPQWKASAGDRDDFSSWIGGIHSGPMGHAELERVSDENLVKEAIRLQSERYFEEGDIWRKFCSADPDRALQGLRLEANKGNWEPTAWRDLLWAADNNGERVFQFELADLLLRMPDALLSELLPYATSWIRQRREILLAADCPGGPHFLRLWDRLALLTYREENPEDVGSISGDINGIA
jgi:SIR2-like domain